VVETVFSTDILVSEVVSAVAGVSVVAVGDSWFGRPPQAASIPAAIAPAVNFSNDLRKVFDFTDIVL
jgi:hypothetical protein